MPQQQIIKSLKSILPQRKKSRFGTLEVYPHDVHFATQNKGERIFVKLRSHIATNLGWLIRGSFLLVMPILVVLFFGSLELFFIGIENDNLASSLLDVNNLINMVPLSLRIGMLLLYFSFVGSYFLIHFLNWYFNIYLVTNERMKHIQFRAFHGKIISEAPLKNIEDITQRISGFGPSVFNYGDVRVQTSAQKNRFFFDQVPDPTWFRDTLADLAKLVQANEP